MLSILIAIASLIPGGASTVCEGLYQGRCIGLMQGSCQAGERQVMSHCGFMQFCCYPDPSLPHPHIISSNIGKCGTTLVTGSSRIMGGTRVKPAEYPWQVSLRENGLHMCGGALIAENWVLSAAHCFTDDSIASRWTVAVGFHDNYVLYSSQIHTVRRIIAHRSYNDDTGENDIALLQLQRPVNTSTAYTRAICLPHPSLDLSPGTVCTVTGWGDNKFEGNGTRYLEKIDLPVVSRSSCNRVYGNGIANVITSNMFCASTNSGGRDSCQGDSGGPYQCILGGVQVLAGVVSRGYRCGVRGYPGIYTRVSAFLPWIHSNMRF